MLIFGACAENNPVSVAAFALNLFIALGRRSAQYVDLFRSADHLLLQTQHRLLARLPMYGQHCSGSSKTSLPQGFKFRR